MSVEFSTTEVAGQLRFFFCSEKKRLSCPATAEVVGFVFSPLTERVDHALLVPEVFAALPGWNVVGPLHSA